jgi:hypothetical protein
MSGSPANTKESDHGGTKLPILQQTARGHGSAMPRMRRVVADRGARGYPTRGGVVPSGGVPRRHSAFDDVARAQVAEPLNYQARFVCFQPAVVMAVFICAYAVL